MDAVDEFMGRIFEELDFRNEALNLERFRATYGPEGSGAAALPPPGVRVPELYAELCSSRVITMEWLQGRKLMEGVEGAGGATGGAAEGESAADLALVRQGVAVSGND